MLFDLLVFYLKEIEYFQMHTVIKTHPECSEGSDGVSSTVLDECPWNDLQGLSHSLVWPLMNASDGLCFLFQVLSKHRYTTDYKVQKSISILGMGRYQKSVHRGVTNAKPYRFWNSAF